MSRLRFNAFSMNCASHIHHGQWVRHGLPLAAREPEVVS
jgi:hypothetical protein